MSCRCSSWRKETLALVEVQLSRHSIENDICHYGDARAGMVETGHRVDKIAIVAASRIGCDDSCEMRFDGAMPDSLMPVLRGELQRPIGSLS